MFGFGGNRSGDDGSDYGGPGEGASHFGGSGLGDAGSVSRGVSGVGAAVSGVGRTASGAGRTGGSVSSGRTGLGGGALGGRGASSAGTGGREAGYTHNVSGSRDSGGSIGPELGFGGGNRNTNRDTGYSDRNGAETSLGSTVGRGDFGPAGNPTGAAGAASVASAAAAAARAGVAGGSTGFNSGDFAAARARSATRAAEALSAIGPGVPVGMGVNGITRAGSSTPADAANAARLGVGAHDLGRTGLGGLEQGSISAPTQAVTADANLKGAAISQIMNTVRPVEGGVTNPYNTLSGGKKANLTDMTVRDVVSLLGTNWNGKIASVGGAFQMKDTTLRNIAEQMGLMDAKFDKPTQDRLALGLISQRAANATVNGKVDVDKFANELAKEWASIATASGKSYYGANGVDKAAIPYESIRSLAGDLVSSGVVGQRTNWASKASEQDFADRFLGGAGSRVQNFTNDFLGPRTDPTISRDYSGKPVVSSAPTNPTPKAGPNAGVGGNNPKPEPGVEYPDRPRSLGEKIAAGAIDVGAGLVPGIGTYVGLGNAALALTGNRTIGERIVDAIMTGEGRPGGVTDSAAYDPERLYMRPRRPTNGSSAKPADPVTPAVADFVDTFLGPTPKQRWVDNRDTYSG